MTTSSPPSDVEIALVTDAGDIPAAYDVVWACFGEQVPDAILEGFNPGWTTPDGYIRAVGRMSDTFKKATKRDKNGDPTKYFVKATATDSSGKRRIAGFAIWIVLSTVDGYGDKPSLDARKALGVEELYPSDPSEQQYLCNMYDGLFRGRHELVQERATASPPAIMCLDLCVVHPDFQRRGIAGKLVQVGLDEAKRRGGLVCCMEASTMGRTVYARLGFKQVGPEIEYGTDGAKFARMGMPSNIFMRTY